MRPRRRSSASTPSTPPRPLPPYGRELEARQTWGSPPPAVLVLVGRDAWRSAKDPRARGAGWARLVLPDGADPLAYRWPVKGLTVILERSEGPTDGQIVQLIKALLWSHAERVAHIWNDWREPPFAYDSRGIRTTFDADLVAGAMGD